MTSEMIEKFIEENDLQGKSVRIHFKERGSIEGIFIKGKDYKELKSKNFWRIVKAEAANEWAKTEDINLTRLFNGITFTKLSEYR